MTGVEALEVPRRQPVPLRGVLLGGGTGLRLVVADLPPFVLDVDARRVTPVLGVPAVKRGVLWIVGVAGRAAVVVQQTYPDAKLYAVRGRGERVSYLGTARRYVTPASDGRAVWVKSAVNRSRCALRLVTLDGRELSPPRAFPCASSIYPGGSLGLVVNRTRVIDPFTGQTVLRTRWGIVGIARKTLVLAGPGKHLTLLEAASRAERQLPWPSILSTAGGSVVDPHGRFVALAFADGAWRGTGKQALDVWILDTKTGELEELPGMPEFVSIKLTSMAWTDDRRLVLLAESSPPGKEMVAVWRPGQRHLALKVVRLPDRSDSGSNSFAPIR